MLFLTPENDFAGEEQVTFHCIPLSFFVVQTSELGNQKCHAKSGLVGLSYFGSFSAYYWSLKFSPVLVFGAAYFF
jgi:hypothetical protein